MHKNQQFWLWIGILSALLLTATVRANVVGPAEARALPFANVGYIKVYWTDAERDSSNCTGVLLTRGLFGFILTSSYCVYRQDKGWFKKIEFTRAYYGTGVNGFKTLTVPHKRFARIATTSKDKFITARLAVIKLPYTGFDDRNKSEGAILSLLRGSVSDSNFVTYGYDGKENVKPVLFGSLLNSNNNVLKSYSFRGAPIFLYDPKIKRNVIVGMYVGEAPYEPHGLEHRDRGKKMPYFWVFKQENKEDWLADNLLKELEAKMADVMWVK